jgi:hypothetical protein
VQCVPGLCLTVVTGNAIQGNCSLALEKRGTLRFSRQVYRFEADSTDTMFRSVETDICMSCSDRDDGVNGRALYEEISAGRQLLKLDDCPTQSRAVISPE